MSNDDGIYAPGLWALVKELKGVGKVVVVTPDREQSAVGTSVTLHQPLRVSEVEPPVPGIQTYSVEGTPADSVIIALGTLVKDKVDLVMAGINQGANLGNDVLISGTVSAALQGYFYNIPSVAISVAAMNDCHFDVAARVGRLVAKAIASQPPGEGLLLNINLPNRPLAQIKGVELTQLGKRTYADKIKEGHDGKRKYYWIVRGSAKWVEDAGTDIWALRRGKVSITPLHSDLAYAVHPDSLTSGLCRTLSRDLLSLA